MGHNHDVGTILKNVGRGIMRFGKKDHSRLSSVHTCLHSCSLGGWHNTTSFESELAFKLFPFSMVYRIQKLKVHLREIWGSAASRTIFLSKKYKFRKSFIFFAQKYCSLEHRKLIFSMQPYFDTTR